MPYLPHEIDQTIQIFVVWQGTPWKRVKRLLGYATQHTDTLNRVFITRNSIFKIALVTLMLNLPENTKVKRILNIILNISRLIYFY